MKKYVKPELFYERYELSQHIANCKWEMNLQPDGKECIGNAEPGLGFDGEIIFTTTLACTATTDNGVYEEYCYHAGKDGMNTFIS